MEVVFLRSSILLPGRRGRRSRGCWRTMWIQTFRELDGGLIGRPLDGLMMPLQDLEFLIVVSNDPLSC